MDKNRLILSIAILSASIILGGFYYASQVNKQQSIERQQAIRIEEDKKADYFKKKIECEEYAEGIKKEIDESNGGRYISIYTETFEMIFYSPKDNSCLYVTHRLTGGREYFIYNALTKNKITSFQFPEQWEDYKEFILEYSDGEIRL
ncbi:MAG: hypothetical protein KAI71_02590 [Candidatus Pacebacteria bacterium]|nr:hypothetical protein [Candidatus Paceibacterota bacterium]